MKWINIIGLVLQFIAFWFAAPELLGVDALKRFEKGLIKLISGLPSILLGVLGIVFGVAMSIYGIYSGMNASETDSDNSIQTIIIILSFSVAYIIYMIFFYKRLQRWIESIFAKPIILNLINNSESRKLALIIGAILFTIGFLCQLVVLLLS